MEIAVLTYLQKFRVYFNYFFGIKDIHIFHHALKEEKGAGFHYEGKEFIHHGNIDPNKSAFYRFSSYQRVWFLEILAILWICLVINWHATVVIAVALLTLLYFSDLLFNLFLIVKSLSRQTEIYISPEELSQSVDAYPKYSILCPLYKEWKVMPQFMSAMNRLDYPKDKLQVLIILEADDHETIENVKKMNLPSFFEVVVVPDSFPKTKPKALNFALKYVRGEYVVIYDAEDIPEQDQLKKVVIAFNKVGPRTVCIQAKLNFYNPHQNLLTRIFTAEYSLWFDLVLTGLQSIGAPIPLGGTSNHFRLDNLKKVEGWDAFNVTEDCDLGIRLVKHGYKTAIVDSNTHEEANSDLFNWFNQRSRWIKGYIQTYFVHMRNPQEFLSMPEQFHFITFQLVVGGKILSMFINPLMWVTTITYFTLRPIVGPTIESFFPSSILYMGVFCLVLGNFLYLYYYAIGCAKRNYDDLVKYTIFVPFYWLCMSISAWKALYEFLVIPHYWAKTVHGLHLDNEKAHAQAVNVTGQGLVDASLRSL